MTYFNKNKELKPGYNAYIDASTNYMGTQMTVSYTHLDVYKSQCQGCSPYFPEIPGGEFRRLPRFFAESDKKSSPRLAVSEKIARGLRWSLIFVWNGAIFKEAKCMRHFVFIFRPVNEHRKRCV